MRQSYCKDCHALIFWGRTKKGKWVALEQDGLAIPNKGGEVMWDELGNQFRGVPTGIKTAHAVNCYRPHVIFCPYGPPPKKRKPTEYAQIQAAKAAEEQAKREEAAAKRAEKERIEKAQREFEARQVKLF